MLSNSMLDFDQSLCNALGRMDVARVVMLIQRGVVLISGVASLFLFGSLTAVLSALALGGVVGAAVSSGVFFRMTGTRFQWRFEGHRWKKIMMDSLPNGIAGFFGGWYIRFAFVDVGMVGPI